MVEVTLMGLAADELVAFLDRHDLLDLRPGGEHFQAGVGAFVSDGPDDRPFHPAHDVGPVAQFSDFPQDFRLVLLRQSRFEDNNHNAARVYCSPFAAPGNGNVRLGLNWPPGLFRLAHR